MEGETLIPFLKKSFGFLQPVLLLHLWGINMFVGLFSILPSRGWTLAHEQGQQEGLSGSSGSLTAFPLTETFNVVPVSLHLGRFSDWEKDRARPVQRSLQSNLSPGQETCGTEEGAGEHFSAEGRMWMFQGPARWPGGNNSALQGLHPSSPCTGFLRPNQDYIAVVPFHIYFKFHLLLYEKGSPNCY